MMKDSKANDLNKLYLLGLFVGGGNISKDTFTIRMPFNKWGLDPSRMKVIARDILTSIQGFFSAQYSLHISYDFTNSGTWIIRPLADCVIGEIIRDLEEYGLPTSGTILEHTSLEIIKERLDDYHALHFLSGIFDTRASVTDSHRRFIDSSPIVSIEVPGRSMNFKFVIQLCSWLTDIGSVTDQILFNHPCQHSSLDPYYKSWKKGFKIRLLARSFMEQHSFLLSEKMKGLSALGRRQESTNQTECPNRQIHSPGPLSVHRELNDPALPEEVRGKVFFHYHHLCAQLGCKYAPRKEVARLVADYRDLISFTPLILKGSIDEIISSYLEAIGEPDPNASRIIKASIPVRDVVEPSSHYSNYPKVRLGLAYLFAERLKGHRHVGNQDLIITLHLDDLVNIWSVSGTYNPLLFAVEREDRAILLSSVQSDINQKLIRKYIATDGLTIEVKNEYFGQ